MTHLRSVCDALAVDLRRRGHVAGADRLEDARSETLPPPEELLVLRSALIRTRSEWERPADAPLAEEARTVLREAKHQAIDGVAP